jgi:hypothetical protein
MGTRNLTMVIDQEGTKKVAQYGQWDGYPSGVGADILKFLKDKQSFDKLKANLKKVRFLEAEGRDKEFIERYDANAPEWSNQPDKRTDEQKRWFSTYCTRDLSAKLLTNIAESNDSEIILLDREETGKSGGAVEYSYLIDLSKNTFEAYNHIDSPALKVYSLDELPDEDVFISDISKAEGEEED